MSMKTPEFSSIELRDESATDAFGKALAAVLPTSVVVGLIGPLGAGKTRLVQAIARAADIEDGIVASPTFVLVHEYQGRVPIFHFDAYRLAKPEEFLGLGPEEYFSGRGWTFVEWADRVSAYLPKERLDIVIEPTGSTSRRLTLIPQGLLAAEIVERLKPAINATSR